MNMSSGETCFECAYCGKKFTEDLAVHCILPDRPATENVCYCVCQDCKDRYLRGEPIRVKGAIKDIKPEFKPKR
jgi:hypothetical protein